MSKQDLLWIDMTDLSSWSGHFTGIQRVVYNIAKSYQEAGTASYFTFDAKTEQFYEFDFTAFREIIEVGPSGGYTVEAPVSRQVKVIGKARQAYSLVPLPVKSVVTPARLKKVARKGYNQYQRATRLKRKLSYLFGAQQPSVTFVDGQTILVLGNSWDRPNLLTNLGKIKQRQNIKILQVVYDLIPVFQPQAFNEELFNKYTQNMFEVATISDGLMAISESSKRDMLRFCAELNIPAPPVSVIRLGDDILASDEPKAPYGVSDGDTFVLCVGTIEARKNHALLYYAWKEGLRSGIVMPKLVIVGRRGWYTDDIIHAFKSDPDTVNRVIILNNASDDELVWLYQHCLFTAYPSYYEGWGLPVAESLAMGKACLTANVSSMPEVGGDLCLYHSPFNAQECLEGVVKLLDSSYRLKVEQRIKDNYKPVLWESTYDQCRIFIAATKG